MYMCIHIYIYIYIHISGNGGDAGLLARLWGVGRRRVRVKGAPPSPRLSTVEPPSPLWLKPDPIMGKKARASPAQEATAAFYACVLHRMPQSWKTGGFLDRGGRTRGFPRGKASGLPFQERSDVFDDGA